MGISLVETDNIRPSEEGLHLRTTAESILNSGEIIARFYDPRSLPIAGLRAFTHEAENPRVVIPQEILSEEHRPVVIYDLDDSIWPHTIHVVKAVSEATNSPITMEEFRKYGHTRKVPQWADNPKVMEIHDQIVYGEHPTYFPYVNIAESQAVATIQATDRMGHNFCYLTARPPKIFEATLRVMRWNGILHNQQATAIDALTNQIPQRGQLYCSHSELTSVNEYKRAVIDQWLTYLRGQGWNGMMVIVDDFLKPFQSLVESLEVLGISLHGDLNANFPPYDGEIREDSWNGIGERLMKVHKQAVAADPNPYRVFTLDSAVRDTLLVVDKREAGVGEFSLGTISNYAFIASEDWQNNRQQELSRLGFT